MIRARDKSDGEQVAIKYIRGACDTLYLAKKTLREVTILGELSKLDSNRHVTKMKKALYFKRKGEHHIFIIMEDGGLDLKSLMDSSELMQFSEKRAKSLVYQLLCGLHYLHSAGVIHRDIKP